MRNVYYKPGAQRAEQVRNLFERIAPRYDLVNDLQSFGLHRRWKRRVAALAAVHPGMAALDVCCGTGDIARELRLSGARVQGVDFSEGMLKVARERESRHVKKGAGASDPSTRVDYARGDAMALPFPGARFDAVTMGYGLRNLADWKKGLAEMARVARSGGRVIVLDFGKPPNVAWRKIYYGYLRLFVPVLGRVFCGDAAAYAYILESLHHYPAQEGVREEMARLNLRDIRVELLLGGVMSINYGVA